MRNNSNNSNNQRSYRNRSKSNSYSRNSDNRNNSGSSNYNRRDDSGRNNNRSTSYNRKSNSSRDDSRGSSYNRRTDNDRSYNQRNSNGNTRSHSSYRNNNRSSYRGSNDQRSEGNRSSNNSNSSYRGGSRGSSNGNRRYSNNSNYRNNGYSSRNRGYGNRGGNNRGRGRRRGQHIDESKFIKDVDLTREVKIYEPEHEFASFKVNPQLKQNVANKGITKPTEIQDKAIPHILEGEDLLGIANTGTGKTLTFLLPTLEKLVNNQKSKVLIITPTRELAKQINDEFRDLSRNFPVYSVLCTGGTNIGKQINGIKRGYNAIIGTPGRIKDLINRQILNPSRFDTVVLDEVDRMLDMGFIHDIKEILSYVPNQRQSLFFSATMDKKVENVINLALTDNYTKISVRTGDTADNVKQDIVEINSPHEKFDKLENMLSQDDFEKVLVFANTKRGVDRIYKMLRDKGFKVGTIHGNKSQNQRQRAINNFKNNTIEVLIATDVAARGIDVDDISHVINYQVPESYQDYTHRIGRTGRANKTGIALTFIERY